MQRETSLLQNSGYRRRFTYSFVSTILIALCFNSSVRGEIETNDASPSAKEKIEREPCGLVDDYLGDVQVLDATKASLTDVKIKGIIYCGTSVTVGKGWAQLRSQNGNRIHMGDQTMIRFPDRGATAIPATRGDNDFTNYFKDDHLVLYKGQIYIQGYEDDDEFRIVSATGRVRIKKAKAVVTFTPQSEATQLIALEDSATLENRFASDQRVHVSGGESSELNFKLLRVVPQIPTAISVASLRPKLVQLEVPEKDIWNAIHTAIARQKRDVVDPLLRPGTKVTPPDQKLPTELKSEKNSRDLASVKEKDPNYFRQSVKDMAPNLRKQWMEQIAGDAQTGEKLLQPKNGNGREQAHLAARNKSQESSQDSIAHLTQTLIRKKKAQDEQEKRRIIHELSQIHSE